MRKHIDLVATCGLALVLAALTMSAWLANENTRQLERNEQWVKHTYDVLAALDGLLATLLDAETGQRGFLLTRESRFLQPYRQATLRVGQMVKTLATHTFDNPTQKDRLPALRSAVDEHLQLLATMLADGDTLGRDRRLDLLDRGKRSMDDIREKVAAMRQEERELLFQRMQRSSRAFGAARVVFLGTTAVTTALVILTHVLLRRDIIGRRRANRRLAAANVRLRDGLRAAAKVQASLLPPADFKCDKAKFAWAFQPCEELAGDALNLCPLAGGQTAMYLLDVSGHGAAAALSAVGVVQALTPIENGRRLALGVETPVYPDETLRALDRQFVWDDELGQFFTICFGIVDPIRREFHYASAGHPPPILVRRGQPPVFLETPAGLPIGVGGDYESSTISLAPGDRIYLYSDGAPETMSPQGALFGGNALLDALARCRDKDLRSGIESVVDELRTWRGNMRAADDLSILAVEIPSNLKN